MKKLFTLMFMLLFVTILGGCTLGQEKEEQVVNIYTDRHYEIDTTIYDNFTKETGIKVNVVKAGSDDLINRLKTEGEDTEADLLVVADAGRLHRAKEADLFQTVTSNTLETNVPANLQDVDNKWFGLTVRARVIVYSKDRVNPADLSTYEDLTTEKWNGKVLIRTSTNIYNQSMLSSFIAINGEQKTKEWAEGLVNNFARDPQGNDRDQAKAIVAGLGDVAIMNTYYVGLMSNSSSQEEVNVANQIGVFFPNQDTTGTHINISGVGVLKHAKNKANAIKLVEYLTKTEAQKLYAEANFEYPVNPIVEPAALLKSWGEFKAQDINLSVLGANYQKATEIANTVNWK